TAAALNGLRRPALGAGAAGGLNARCVRFRSHRVDAAGAACDPKRAPLDAPPSQSAGTDAYSR
ncbi:MAG TPA: hypothetical protein PK992_08900, partial [Planctomycetaceae bacterium]|nr:hypothetical protein [Planctomycetaceae bacterium]